jgi:hypothetical protein
LVDATVGGCSPLGATEAIMLAHGFTSAMLDALVRDELATAERRAMKAGRRRIAALGRSGSWPEIIADLDSLTETEIEQDGKRFTVRSAPRPAASLAIRAAGVALPPTVRGASA